MHFKGIVHSLIHVLWKKKKINFKNDLYWFELLSWIWRISCVCASKKNMTPGSLKKTGHFFFFSVKSEPYSGHPLFCFLICRNTIFCPYCTSRSAKSVVENQQLQRQRIQNPSRTHFNLVHFIHLRVTAILNNTSLFLQLQTSIIFTSYWPPKTSRNSHRYYIIRPPLSCPITRSLIQTDTHAHLKPKGGLARLLSTHAGNGREQSWTGKSTTAKTCINIALEFSRMH